MRVLMLLAAAAAMAVAEDFPPTPYFALLSGGGFHMSIPDEPGMTLFAVHYSINKPVNGVDAGDYNYDINEKTGDRWVHENPEVTVNEGDIIYYWIYVLKDGAGYQKLDQSWTADPATITPTTKGPTTTTTQGPSTTTTTTTPRITTTTQPYTGPPTTYPTKPTTGPETPVCTSYPCLIFEDEFETLNLNNWEHELTAGGGGNWEFQYYLNNRTNSYTKNGHLFLRPTLTSDRYGEEFLSSGHLDIWGSAPPNMCTGPGFYGCFRVGNQDNIINPIQSARLRTVNKFNFKYGKVEVRARMPKGDWLWPAIWMLPEREEYGIWPASGEIDLIESRGNLDLVDENNNPRGNTYGGATLHWGPFYPQNGYERTTSYRNADFGDNMHTFAMEWEEDEIRLYIDGEMVLRVDPGPDGFWKFGEFDQILPNEESNPWRHSSSKMAPFDKEFYFVMNVAVGGTNGFFPDRWTNRAYPKPWSNTSPTAFRDFWNARDKWYPTWNGEDAAMEVDYIRVWKLKDN